MRVENSKGNLRCVDLCYSGWHKWRRGASKGWHTWCSRYVAKRRVIFIWIFPVRCGRVARMRVATPYNKQGKLRHCHTDGRCAGRLAGGCGQ